jgi:hypothetical protein
METVKDLLERYRRYLVVMDEWAASWDGERLDLLSPGEAFDILSIRDRLAEARLAPAERAQLERLDDLLIRYRDVVAGNAPPDIAAPPERWWWRLDEGPRVRDEARAAGLTTSRSPRAR